MLASPIFDPIDSGSTPRRSASRPSPETRKKPSGSTYREAVGQRAGEDAPADRDVALDRREGHLDSRPARSRAFDVPAQICPRLSAPTTRPNRLGRARALSSGGSAGALVAAGACLPSLISGAPGDSRRTAVAMPIDHASSSSGHRVNSVRSDGSPSGDGRASRGGERWSRMQAASTPTVARATARRRRTNWVIAPFGRPPQSAS